MGLQQSLASELLNAKNSVSDVDKTALELRKQISDKEAEIVMKYIKLSMKQIINAGVPLAQDGGASLKTSMLAAVDTL